MATTNMTATPAAETSASERTFPPSNMVKNLPAKDKTTVSENIGSEAAPAAQIQRIFLVRSQAASLGTIRAARYADASSPSTRQRSRHCLFRLKYMARSRFVAASSSVWNAIVIKTH